MSSQPLVSAATTASGIEASSAVVYKWYSTACSLLPACPPRPSLPCHITDFHTADQMCLWCYHHILEEAAKASLDARCPNCRSSYDEEKIQMQHIDAEQ